MYTESLSLSVVPFTVYMVLLFFMGSNTKYKYIEYRSVQYVSSL
jgi:hypothetical protein